MALRIKSSQDFCTGCAFIAFGAATVVLASEYSLGSAARMGPGYFPTVLGWLLAAIGALVLLKSLASTGGGSIGRLNPWLLLRLLVAIAAFALLLNPLGLVATTVIVVMLAASAGYEFRFGEALLNAALLALLAYLLFVWGLNQPIPVWPRFLAM